MLGSRTWKGHFADRNTEAQTQKELGMDSRGSALDQGLGMGPSVLLNKAGWGGTPILPQSGFTGSAGMACSPAFPTVGKCLFHLSISYTGRPQVRGLWASLGNTGTQRAGLDTTLRAYAWYWRAFIATLVETGCSCFTDSDTETQRCPVSCCK